MEGEIDAVGDALTGGVGAGAVAADPGARGRAHPVAAHGLCLNCGTALLGDHCHRCGQPGHLHRSLSAIWHDIAHGVLHFEGKLWNTLPLLVWRPGDLTRRYIHGERARFVSPMALFLFSVFLMFALFSLIGATLKVDGLEGPAGPSARAQAEAAQRELVTDLAEIDARIAAARAAGQPTEELELQRESVAAIARLADGIVGPAPGERPGINIETGIPLFDKAIAKANANPNLLLYKIQSNAYKFSWLLIPISTPFLWLMFAWRRQYRVYDHAVFVTYSLAFMTLFVIVLTLAGAIGVASGTIGAAVLLVPPLHMYRQMRGAYRLRRRSAVLRTLMLLTVAVCCLATFAGLLVGAGAFG